MSTAAPVRNKARALVLGYGTLCYVIFFATFLYAFAFVGNLAVPKTIDAGTQGGTAAALIVNLLLLSVFALQHTVMARQGFKNWWTRIVPEPIERSTYVLLSSLALILLFWLWRPMTAVLWSVEHSVGHAVLQGTFYAGWLIVLLSTFMISHFDLFGLRQVWLHWQDKSYGDLQFRTTGFYKLVRHPLQLGFVIGFWATPHMTVGHLLFAGVTTAYIIVALKFFEEPDLVRMFGDRYLKYRAQVPMLIPRARLALDEDPAEPAAAPPTTSR